MGCYLIAMDDGRSSQLQVNCAAWSLFSSNSNHSTIILSPRDASAHHRSEETQKSFKSYIFKEYFTSGKTKSTILIYSLIRWLTGVQPLDPIVPFSELLQYASQIILKMCQLYTLTINANTDPPASRSNVQTMLDF